MSNPELADPKPETNTQDQQPAAEDLSQSTLPEVPPVDLGVAKFDQCSFWGRTILFDRYLRG